MENIDNEVDQVYIKFSDLKENTDLVLNNLLTTFEEISGSLSLLDNGVENVSLDESQLGTIKETLNNMKQELQLISAKHRDLHGSVAKVGKAIEKNCVSDFESIVRPDFIEDENTNRIINKSIAHYYYTHGCAEVAMSLIEEANFSDEDIRPVFEEKNFAELYKIYQEILARNIQPAFYFVCKYSADLEINSTLEFKLYKLMFTEILQKGMSGQSEALEFARDILSKYSEKYEAEIQELMAALIYLPNGVENSPFKHLLSSDMWLEFSYIFLKDACNMLGINKDSPLSVIVDAGITALPTALSMEGLFPSNWFNGEKLPIDFNLGSNFVYHSRFVCPILRQVSTDDNPPMRLVCGHVISNNALTEITHGRRLQCPYCFVRQSRNMAKQIYF